MVMFILCFGSFVLGGGVVLILMAAGTSDTASRAAMESRDGVSLISCAHPKTPWYKRLWFWVSLQWLYPPLDPDSLEDIEIHYVSSARKEALKAADLWKDPLQRNKYLQLYREYDDHNNLLNKAQNTMSDHEIEEEIQAKGLTAPRVTLADIEACIAYEYYTTGDQIQDDPGTGAGVEGNGKRPYHAAVVSHPVRVDAQEWLYCYGGECVRLA